MFDFYYFLIFMSQLLFNVLKVLEIKFTYNNEIKKLLVNSVLINLVSIGSLFVSFERLLKGDWIVLPYYIIGSLLGKWIGMTKINKFKLIRDKS